MGGRGGSSRIGGGKSEVDSIKSIAEMKAWVLQNRWFVPGSEIDLEGIPIGAARGIVKAYEAVFKKWPQLKGAFSGVSVKTLDDGVYAQCYMSSGKIEVNLLHFQSVKALKRQYAKDIGSGFHAAGTDWQDIITHEIGHAIDGYISRKLSATDSQYSNRYYNSTTLQEKIAKKLGYSLDHDSIAKISTRYGATRPAEWLAESFAEGFSAKHPRENAKELMSELKRLLRMVKDL